MLVKCHVSTALSDNLGVPVHMHIVSVSTMWQPVNTCLHACHVPVRLQGDIGMPFARLPCPRTAIWMCNLFAHVPWPRDNTWLHRQTCSHWVRVPVLPHGDGSLPVHIVLSPDNTGSLLHTSTMPCPALPRSNVGPSVHRTAIPQGRCMTVQGHLSTPVSVPSLPHGGACTLECLSAMFQGHHMAA